VKMIKVQCHDCAGSLSAVIPMIDLSVWALAHLESDPTHSPSFRLIQVGVRPEVEDGERLKRIENRLDSVEMRWVKLEDSIKGARR
jgi:hypothetical protein